MTMSDNIVINAKVRNDLGKGASRRLRRNAEMMPAILYGGKDEPQSLMVLHREMAKAAENEALYSSILDINVDGTVVQGILKDLQRHPARPIILHADFLRVDRNKKIQVHVPLHFINEEQSPGVKMEGARVQHNMVEVEVSCLPDDLPEYIEVDMLEAKLGDIVHISDLKLPQGVESVALSHGEDHDLPVASLAAPKGAEEEEIVADSADDAGDAAEDAGDSDE
jgi:large subunit ribosomal protein L25